MVVGLHLLFLLLGFDCVCVCGRSCLLLVLLGCVSVCGCWLCFRVGRVLFVVCCGCWLAFDVCCVLLRVDDVLCACAFVRLHNCPCFVCGSH